MLKYLFSAKTRRRRPTYIHYLKVCLLCIEDPRIVMNVFAINPNRFLAIFSFLMLLIGIVSGFIIWVTNQYLDNNIYLLEIVSEVNVKFTGWYVATASLTLFLCIIFTLPITLLLSRRDPQQYVKIMSVSASLTQLLKITSMEVYRIVSQTSTLDDDAIAIEIPKFQNAFTIINGLIRIIADRLHITEEDVAEKILKFDPMVFINRETQRAFGYRRSDDNKSPNLLNNGLECYLNRKLLYLNLLRKSKLNFDDLELLFQTRSVSGAMQLYIEYIEKNAHILLALPSNEGEFFLLKQIQKAYRDGAVNYRAIGQLLCACNELSNKAEIGKILFRLKCLSLNADIKADINSAHCLFSWGRDAIRQVNEQRKTIATHFLPHLRKIVETHPLQTGLKSSKSKKSPPKTISKIYLVTYDYSRALKTALENVIQNNAKLDSDTKFDIVCLRNGDNLSDFGSRLMYHQLLKEHPDKNISRKLIKEHLAMVSFENFYAEFKSETDLLIFVSGCDFIEKDATPNMYLPISILTKIMNGCNAGLINVVGIAGTYKRRLHDINVNKKLKLDEETLNKILPLKRRYNSNPWNNSYEKYSLGKGTSKNIIVELITDKGLDQT